MTGWTNSTATCRAWAGHCGATHHMVAPAAKRRARDRAAAARSSAGPGRVGCSPSRPHAAIMPRPAGGAAARDGGLPQGQTAVVGGYDPVREDLEAAAPSSSRRARPSSSDVLEDAAAQGDDVDAGLRALARPRTSPMSLATATWKPAAIAPRGRRTAQVVDQGPQHRGRVDGRRRTGRTGTAVPGAPSSACLGRPLRAPWRPAPRRTPSWRTPSSELTASKRRPMLEVGTHARPALELAGAGPPARRAPARPTGGRSSAHSMPAAHRWASAAR